MRELYIGIEIGATKCQASLGTAEGELLDTRMLSVVLEEGAEGILGWMRQDVADLVALARGKGDGVASIAVGFGGIIESATGRILTSVQVKGWKDCMLRDWFQDAFGLPTAILNDTVAGGYGESILGTGRGTRVFFYTNIGSGIGGCLIIDGACYDGMGYGAAYFGHTWVPDWTASSPGARRKVEDMCSGWAIERRLRSPGYVPAGSLLLGLCGGRREALRCATLAQAARQGDAFALAEIDRTADSLATGLSNVITLFSPECVAIGGGVANMGDVLLDPVRRMAAERVFISAAGRYRIEQCSLLDMAVPVGAVLYAARHPAG